MDFIPIDQSESDEETYELDYPDTPAELRQAAESTLLENPRIAAALSEAAQIIERLDKKQMHWVNESIAEEKRAIQLENFFEKLQNYFGVTKWTNIVEHIEYIEDEERRKRELELAELEEDSEDEIEYFDGVTGELIDYSPLPLKKRKLE